MLEIVSGIVTGCQPSTDMETLWNRINVEGLREKNQRHPPPPFRCRDPRLCDGRVVLNLPLNSANVSLVPATVCCVIDLQ